MILQEYIPRQDAEDWIVHLYCDANSNCMANFTGVKVRSWPPHVGMTACAYMVPNPGLAEMASWLTPLGFRRHRGPRLAARPGRDGEYKLLDFNPRVGAQFRLFETADGIDVELPCTLTCNWLGGPAQPTTEPGAGWWSRTST